MQTHGSHLVPFHKIFQTTTTTDASREQTSPSPSTPAPAPGYIVISVKRRQDLAQPFLLHKPQTCRWCQHQGPATTQRVSSSVGQGVRPQGWDEP